ncbi:MAG: aminotransferase class V-fold PLP-dependent enzyme [Verrucomicrobiaceae bacterium]|nr:aminotransferase class V-fold PLP-dependent enzyme [Verrucomicrobiaceae bacterium]
MTFIDTLIADESLRLAEFPVARDSIFMAHAGVTILPRRATRAMQEYLEGSCVAMQEFPAAWRAMNETRALAAKLIGAKASEIALLGPTSVGLSLVANGLDWQPGDEVVCYLEDYPANVYPWLELQRRGVVVKFLQPTALGAITPEVVEQALTTKTKLVALASCHFLTGNRIQIDVIGQMLRARGILFCLDAIQTVGAFETVVEHVDFLSADSHKWMLGPMAAGIVYVKEELQDVLRPTLLGAWNIKSPNFIAQTEIEWEAGARRYEPGVLNMAGILGMKASIELINEATVAGISARLLHLRDCLRDALTPLGFHLIESSNGCLPSGICTFSHPTRDLAPIFVHLAAHKINISHRHDRTGQDYLRFSPHFYNTEHEVERIAELLVA